MRKLEKLYAGDFLRDKYDITIQKSFVEDYYPKHSHDFIEIAYIASGSGLHTVEDQEFRIAQGDLFILSKNVAHEFLADKGRGLLVYNCIFQPDFIDGSLGKDDDFIKLIYQYLTQGPDDPEDRNSYLKLTGVPSQEVEQIFEEMLEEYERREIGYVHFIRSDLVRLLIYVFRQQGQQPSAGSKPAMLNRLMVQNTIEYMRMNYEDEITVGDLAAKFYLSSGYFSRIFKEITGMTVVTMLQTVRIQKACEFLKTTAKPVTEIAYDVGYQDMKYFYELFRRLKGTSPKQYQKKHSSLEHSKKVQDTPIK